MFGSRQQVQQLEMENNRLLSEFRAERQRRETAEQTAQQLEIRLAESEKMLARQIQGTHAGRLSSLPGAGNWPETNGSLNQRSPEPAPAGGDFRWQRRAN